MSLYTQEQENKALARLARDIMQLPLQRTGIPEQSELAEHVGHDKAQQLIAEQRNPNEERKIT